MLHRKWASGISKSAVCGFVIASSPGNSQFQCVALKNWEWPGDEARYVIGSYLTLYDTIN